MDTIQLMKSIDTQYRKTTGLSPAYYRIFYSRIDPSDVLVLGINPGGHPGTWSGKIRQYYPHTWIDRMLTNEFFFEAHEHEYVDCSYPIQQTMLSFLKEVLATDDNGIRRVPKANVAFRRSKDEKAFKSIHGISLREAKKEARPYVEEILGSVKPKIVLLEGIGLLDDFHRLYCSGQPDRLAGPISDRWGRHDARIFEAWTVRVNCLERSVSAMAIAQPSKVGRRQKFKQEVIPIIRDLIGRS